MRWFKLNSDYYTHIKVVRVGIVGEVLFVRSIAYAQQNESDGFIPDCMLPIIGAGISESFAEPQNLRKLADVLVDVGLWDRHDDGWMIHDYLDYQRSRFELDIERERVRKAMAETRAKSQSRTERDNSKKDLSRANGHDPVTPMLQRNTDVTDEVTDDKGTYESLETSSSSQAKSEMNCAGEHASTHMQGTHASAGMYVQGAPLELTDFNVNRQTLSSFSYDLGFNETTRLFDGLSNFDVRTTKKLKTDQRLPPLKPIANFHSAGVQGAGAGAREGEEQAVKRSSYYTAILPKRDRETVCGYETMLGDDTIAFQTGKLEKLDPRLDQEWLRLRLRVAYSVVGPCTEGELFDRLERGLEATTAAYRAIKAGKLTPRGQTSRYVKPVYHIAFTGEED